MRFWVIVLFICAILVCGCSAPTPEGTPQITPEMINAAMPSPTVTEFIQPTLAPIHSRITTSIPTVGPTRTPDPTDPIVGKWVLMNKDGYDCNVIFNDDKTGKVNCYSVFIPLVNEDFTWDSMSTPYGFMRNYTVTMNSNKNNYGVLYSVRTGEITSDLIPHGGYLVKENLKW